MREVERRIAAVAASQDGVISRGQLIRAGLTPHQIGYRLRTERYQRLHQGIYLLAPGAPSLRQRMRAATLLGGWLSHLTGAALWRMLPATVDAAIDLSISGRHLRSRDGVTVHRVQLAPADRKRCQGLPITSPIRTLCDLAATEPRRLVEEALTEAVVHRTLQLPQDRALSGRLARHPGAALVRRLLAVEQEHGFTRSEAERRLRSLLVDSGLPMPRFNVRVHGHLVDCVWPAQRVVLEVDGFSVHGSRRAFEADRCRDQDLAAAGYRVIRITWRQLTQEPMRVVVRLAQGLHVSAAPV